MRLQRRIEEHTLPFEMVQGKIADMLEARGWAMAATLYAAGLARSAQIEGVLIDPAAIGIA